MARLTIQHIAQQLLKARKDEGLSQRALANKIGVPQGHISKIENGVVDLTTSSLIAMTRALDMEVMLVPRKLIPTVDGLINASQQEQTDGEKVYPAYRLDEDENNG